MCVSPCPSGCTKHGTCVGRNCCWFFLCLDYKNKIKTTRMSDCYWGPCRGLYPTPYGGEVPKLENVINRKPRMTSKRKDVPKKGGRVVAPAPRGAERSSSTVQTTRFARSGETSREVTLGEGRVVVIHCVCSLDVCPIIVRHWDLDVAGGAKTRYDVIKKRENVKSITAATCNHVFHLQSQLINPIRTAPLIMFAYDKLAKKREHVGVLFTTTSLGERTPKPTEWFIDILCAQKVSDTFHPYRGLGSHMVKMFHDLARQAGKTKIWIDTTRGASGFWEHQKYKYETDPPNFINPYENEAPLDQYLAPIHMVSHLNSHDRVLQALGMGYQTEPRCKNDTSSARITEKSKHTHTHTHRETHRNCKTPHGKQARMSRLVDRVFFSAYHGEAHQVDKLLASRGFFFRCSMRDRQPQKEEPRLRLTSKAHHTTGGV